MSQLIVKFRDGTRKVYEQVQQFRLESNVLSADMGDLMMIAPEVDSVEVREDEQSKLVKPDGDLTV